MVELLFPATLRQDMRDVIYTPYRSRFKECLQRLRNVNFFVVDLFSILRFTESVNLLWNDFRSCPEDLTTIRHKKRPVKGLWQL